MLEDARSLEMTLSRGEEGAIRVIAPAILVALFMFTAARDSLSQSQNAPFEWPSSYTIEYVQKAPGDPFKNIYSVSGNKARNESVVLKTGAQPCVTIYDLDKQVMITLFPSSVYKESSTKDIRNMRIRHMFDTNGTWEKVSSEKINGEDSIKYKLTYSNSGKFLYIWLSVNTKEPLRAANPDETWFIEVSRYVPGPVDNTLFVVPAGYRSWDELPH